MSICSRQTVRGLSLLLAVIVGAVGCNSDMHEAPPMPSDPIVKTTIVTDGVDLDADGYVLTIDGTAQHVDVNATQTIALAAGHHTIDLSGVAGNCTTSNPSSWVGDLEKQSAVTVAFHVTCTMRRVAFSSNRSGTYNVWTMNRDGTNLVQLTTGPSETPAGWSPDGSKLTYTGTANGHRQVFVVDANGSNVRQLTTSAGDNRGGTWSPDRRRIVFTSSRDGNDEIYEMDADGSNQTRITNTAGVEDAPQWSPDGSMIAYTYYTSLSVYSGPYGGPDFEVRVINADGTGMRQPFATLFSVRRSASWSPDSERLILVQHDVRVRVPFVLCAGALTDDHCEPIATSDSLDAEVPRWSPDGQTLTYSRRIGLTDELHIIGADGVDRRLLPASTSSDYYLVWRP